MLRYAAQHDVACSVFVPVALECAGGALEKLVSAELIVDGTTTSTGLASVRLADYHHSAPGVFACLVDEPALEAVVRPGGHGPRRLAPDASLASADHLLCLKLGKQHEVVAFAEKLGQLAVQVVDEVSDSPSDAGSGLPQAPALVVGSGRARSTCSAGRRAGDRDDR